MCKKIYKWYNYGNFQVGILTRLEKKPSFYFNLDNIRNISACMQHTLYFKKKQEKAYLILKDLAFNTKNICALQYFEGRNFFFVPVWEDSL